MKSIRTMPRTSVVMPAPRPGIFGIGTGEGATGAEP